MNTKKTKVMVSRHEMKPQNKSVREMALWGLSARIRQELDLLHHFCLSNMLDAGGGCTPVQLNHNCSAPGLSLETSSHS